ncbi:ubiquitin-like small modifier protein 1 [Thermanaerovibrio velox]|uniref:ubiquitin-like small modifier protein 1 n=1 Tax=Thermanaerovibrio velox TaxID=108007 RepID=UPI001FDFF031|nr:ubiquitin-like small modifier protein 1 [Thermanaerovibrio velox]
MLFFATFRELAGRREDQAEASTVRELLEVLSRRYGRSFHDAVLKDGAMSDQVIVLVNGHHVAHLDGEETRLNPDDQVSIFPVIGGG